MCARRRRIVAKNARQRVLDTVAGKRVDATDHLVQDTTEGEHVDSRVDGPTLDLLGRHVSGGADDRAHGRAQRRWRAADLDWGGGSIDPCARGVGFE